MSTLPKLAVAASTRPLISTRLGHVGAIVFGADAEFGREAVLDRLDFARIAEAVQHHIGALSRERSGYAKPDAAGRTGDDR